MDERRVFSTEARNALIERTTKRLITAIVVVSLTLLATNGMWLYLYLRK